MNSTDRLHLQLTEMPKSPDLVIHNDNDDDNNISYFNFLCMYVG